MNYYERHLGDYARDTAHLTMVEHGAYTLLLDRYYATEQGIPDAQVHRLARARTEDERAAVDAVLSEFFRLVDGLWVHGRVEEEIEKAHARITAAQENGKKGGRPRKKETQEKPTGFSLGFENETQQEPSEKLTNLHTPDTTKSERDTHASDAGVLGTALRKAGCVSVAMNHPEFLKALEEGVTAGEATDGVEIAKANGVNGAGMWLYAIRTARSNHAKTASTIDHPNSRAGPRSGTGKVMGLLQTLEGMKDGLDQSGISNGLPDAGYARLGRSAGD